MFCPLLFPAAVGGTQDSSPWLNHTPVPIPNEIFLKLKPVWYVGLSRSEDNLADNLALLNTVTVVSVLHRLSQSLGPRLRF